MIKEITINSKKKTIKRKLKPNIRNSIHNTEIKNILPIKEIFFTKNHSKKSSCFSLFFLYSSKSFTLYQLLKCLH